MSDLVLPIMVVIAFAVVMALSFLEYRAAGRKPQVSNLDPEEELALRKMVASAAGVMRNLGSSGDRIEDMDVLSTRSKNNVALWLEVYDEFDWKKRRVDA